MVTATWPNAWKAPIGTGRLRPRRKAAVNRKVPWGLAGITSSQGLGCESQVPGRPAPTQQEHLMKNKTIMILRGTICLLTVVAVSGAYAQGGYGEGSRIMARPSASPAAGAATAGAHGATTATAISAQDKHFINSAANGG